MLWVWWEQIESGTVLDEFHWIHQSSVTCFIQEKCTHFFQVDRNQCFYFQFSSVATSGFFFFPAKFSNLMTNKKALALSSNAPTWKKRYSQSFVPVMSGREWDSIRQAVGAWVVGLVVFFPFFPLKTIQFSTNKVQGKHESGMVLDTNSGLFTLSVGFLFISLR